jgi:ribose transport system substrate-binding protein
LKSLADRRAAILRSVAFALTILSVVIIAACGGDDDTQSGEAPSSSAKARTAVFLATTANPWWQAHLAGLREVVESNGGSVTVFDGKYDSAAQYNQIQDAITSGNFDAFVIGSIDGGALVPVAEDAISAGIKVLSFGTALGNDLSTAEPQLEGQVGAEVLVATMDGTRRADLVADACGSVAPCEVAYLMGTRKSAWDSVGRTAFLAKIKESPDIKVVGEAEGQFLRAPAVQAAQDLLQAHPGLDVIATSADQMTLGALQAVKDSNKSVKLVGSSICNGSWKAIQAGEVFGSTVSLPRTAGEAIGKMLIKSIKGTPIADRSIDDSEQSPSGPVVTGDVDDFTPQYDC